MYFALRYWKRLNRNRWLFLCLALLFVTTCGSGNAESVVQPMYVADAFESFLPKDVLNILVVIYDVVLDRNIPRQPAYGMLLASTATKL